MKKNLLDTTKKVVIAIIGVIVILLGLIMVPYPGPGWLVVFAGLAILASEFDFAQEILTLGKNKYQAWQDWVNKQGLAVQCVIWFMMGVVIVLTIWLLNGYGFMAKILGIDINWLTSPFFK